MAIRNPLGFGYVALRCAALAAALGASIGCNAYSEELLRRRGDDDGESDARRDTEDDARTSGDVVRPEAGDVTRMEDGSNERPVLDGDATPLDKGADASIADAGVLGPDVPMPPADGRAPDEASSDVAPGDRSVIDALVDRGDATGPSDADAATPLDATHDAAADARDATAIDTSDGGGFDGALDVPTDTYTPPPTLRVVRVGDGATELSSSSAPVFIEERRWDGALIGAPLALPAATSGRQRPLTLAGNAAAEGALSLSLDGRYLTLAGYATVPGRTAIAASNDVERVVARVDAAGTIDTSTSLGRAFLGTNVRSATSVDGTGFWVGGAAGGVWYLPFAGTSGVQIVESPDNVRLLALFGDALYGVSGAAPTTSVFTVGSGRPTSGIQDVALLTGMPPSGSSPYAFVLFDRDPGVPGLDTLYLTDDRNPESDGTGGGVQKWTLARNRWQKVATFSAVGHGEASFRGLTGIATPNGVGLVASTAEPSGNRLVLFLDDGSTGVTGTVIAAAASNTVFRGVALSPHP